MATAYFLLPQNYLTYYQDNKNRETEHPTSVRAQKMGQDKHQNPKSVIKKHTKLTYSRESQRKILKIRSLNIWVPHTKAQNLGTNVWHCTDEFD